MSIVNIKEYRSKGKSFYCPPYYEKNKLRNNYYKISAHPVEILVNYTYPLNEI